MSEEGGTTVTGVMISLFGFILLVLGLILIYFSNTTEVGTVDPRLFIPIGIAVSIIGVYMIVAKKV